MTDRREREDGIAASQLVNALVIMREIAPEGRQSAATAFLAGCSHVRNSAEWKAMKEVVSLAELYCCLTTQLPSSQEMLIKLRAALQELDRLRGDK